MRDSYKDFADMATEYDMLYLCNAAVAGIGEGRFHPEILKQFAKELWAQKEKEGADIALCYEIWNRDGEIQMALLRAWLEGKGISWERTGWRRKRSSAAWRRCSGRGM